MNIRLIALAAGFAVLASVPAFAADEVSPLEQFDANKDNIVTEAEYMAEAKVRFDELDANKDAMISLEEAVTAFEASKAQREEELRKLRAERKAEEAAKAAEQAAPAQ